MESADRPVVEGLVCAACGAAVPLGSPLVTCPNSSPADRRHVLHFVSRVVPFRPVEGENPFLAYRRYLAVDAHGAALGLDDGARERIIAGLDASIATVAGTGFRRTPMFRAGALSAALGFSSDGGIWVKDETRNVGGSHKARHLFTEMVFLLMCEEAGSAAWDRRRRPHLAIASCGNAAVAAATVAAAVEWPIDVFVPPAASEAVIAMLEALGASVTVCPPREGDPPGDPCIHRFREAVAAGSVPFGVQGTENAWCRDGGRTIGWEVTEVTGHSVDRIFVQVGGGALAACVGESLRASGVHPALHAVQARGCAPLERAWRRAAETGGIPGAGARWAECMWPWEEEPHSLADGILDQETYDWVGVVESMGRTSGTPVVASEEQIVEAHQLALAHTDVNVSATGTAGLAGVLAVRGEIDDAERVVVIFSGVRR